MSGYYQVESVYLYSVEIIVLFLGIWFLWRITSRKKSVPWPSWLHWAVEIGDSRDVPFLSYMIK